MTEAQATPPSPAPWWKKPALWLAALGTLLVGLLVAFGGAFTAGRKSGRKGAVEDHEAAADQVEADITTADATIDAAAQDEHAAIDAEPARAPTRKNVEASMREARGGPHAGRRRD